MILDLLASGEVTLSTVRLRGRHLSPKNHEAVLARAKGRTRQQIDMLVAELAPRPDVPPCVRRLPTVPASSAAAVPAPASVSSSAEPAAMPVPSRAAFLSAPRPVVKPAAPQRYRVQFTIDQETHDEFRRLQALLRREIPDGDPAVIFKRAVKLMLEKVENKKLGITKKPRRANVIRPGTDGPRPRTAPRGVKRVIWRKDVGNISLRCWRHNQYEAELIFVPRKEM